MAVVKDCAYGCGGAEVSRELERKGINVFAVARIDEARALRDCGLRSMVLVLGRVGGDDLAWAVTHNVHLVLNDMHDLMQWRDSGLPVAFHCGIDTGMGRLGIRTDDIAAIADMATGSAVRLEGLCSHFACADSKDSSSAVAQLQLLRQCFDALSERGMRPPMVHIANSAGISRLPWPDWMTHCRPGIALYGCQPDPANPLPFELRPVAALKARVVKVSAVAAGTPISYGWTWKAPRDTRIATIGAGYGHGVPRYLSSCGTVLVAGTPRPIAGRVTMDYVMVDLGDDTSVQCGDEAVFFGEQDGAAISPDTVAATGNTIAYELLCNLPVRLPRCYIRNGAVRSWSDAHLY